MIPSGVIRLENTELMLLMSATFGIDEPTPKRNVIEVMDH